MLYSKETYSIAREHIFIATVDTVFTCAFVWSGYRMCSLATECVLLLQNVFSWNSMCSLATECVLLLQNVFSCYRIVIAVDTIFPCTFV